MQQLSTTYLPVRGTSLNKYLARTIIEEHIKQPQTDDPSCSLFMWELPEELTARIAETDEAIEWFEILIVTNNNASITKIYIDDIQLIGAEFQASDSEIAQ